MMRAKKANLSYCQHSRLNVQKGTIVEKKNPFEGSMTFYSLIYSTLFPNLVFGRLEGEATS